VPGQVLHHRVEVAKVQHLAVGQRAKPFGLDVARGVRASVGTGLHLLERLGRHTLLEKVRAVPTQQRREARLAEHLVAIGVVHEDPRPALFREHLRVAEVIEVPVAHQNAAELSEIEPLLRRLAPQRGDAVVRADAGIEEGEATVCVFDDVDVGGPTRLEKRNRNLEAVNAQRVERRVVQVDGRSVHRVTSRPSPRPESRAGP
jgi:hypothetical protein